MRTIRVETIPLKRIVAPVDSVFSIIIDAGLFLDFAGISDGTAKYWALDTFSSSFISCGIEKEFFLRYFV